MLRFKSNRSWAFVLTLCLFTTCSCLFTVQLPAVAHAGSSDSFSVSADEPPPLSVGDPDVPTGPGDGKAGKFSVVRNGSNQVVRQNEACPVGDGAALTSVAKNSVRLFLLSLRSLYLRF
jgi:hypothetical protein